MNVRLAVRSEVSDSAIGGRPKRSRTPSTPLGFQKRMKMMHAAIPTSEAMTSVSS